MVLDEDLKFTENKALTATGLTNTLHLSGGALGKGGVPYAANPAIGEPLALLIRVNALPVATGTYSAALRTSATVDGNGDLSGSPDTLISQAISATAPAGTFVVVPLSESWSYKDYLQVTMTLGGTDPAINFSAWLVPVSSLPAWMALPAVAN
jgi:hypothetical protein